MSPDAEIESLYQKKVEDDLCEYLQEEGTHHNPEINQMIEEELNAAFTQNEALRKLAEQALHPLDVQDLDSCEDDLELDPMVHRDDEQDDLAASSALSPTHPRR